ncbi:hypothetical protein HPB47_021667 [Ixodes persulcatus]|uniref:Uncharacterized protein n=1 Tax=Ixodes persulcatus TaxID=34615 RepID=A0AC60QC20_IXOPE|nr:hypothetical protein HPB47_021667 [Ixodes persulcatus]
MHILTMRAHTYTSDQRFHSIRLEGSENWTLEVRYTQKGDAGAYESQVSSELKMSLNFSLAVVCEFLATPGITMASVIGKSEAISLEGQGVLPSFIALAYYYSH